MDTTYRPSLRVIELENENRQLLKRIAEQEQEVGVLRQTIQDLQIKLAQLQTMLFKQKRIPNEDQSDDSASTGAGESTHQPRSVSSYRRAIPLMQEITKIKEIVLDHCTQCGHGYLGELDVRSVYVEDIPEVKKEVIHHRIHVYQCIACGHHQSAEPIPRGSQVILGPRVKAWILYGAYILHLSDTDIIRYLWNTYQLKVSNGEIHVIQQQSAQHLRSTYNGIRDTLNQQETTHVDETGWQVGGNKQYAWGRVSPTIPDVLIHMGNRGGGNADTILKGFSGCVTSDCYGGYKNLHIRNPGMTHQICWVHILREAKEVARSPYLTKEQQTSAKQFQTNLQTIYHDLKEILATPFDLTQRKTRQWALQKRLSGINQLLPCDTPKKLKNIKLRTQEYAKELFTCLQYRTALPENNLAERSLRSLVIKRKRSFGSATQKGANIFSINFSVVYSFWKKFPDAFFPELQKLLVD